MQTVGGIGLLVAAAVLHDRRKWRTAGIAAAVMLQSLGLSFVPVGYAALGLASRAISVLRTELQRNQRPITQLEWAQVVLYGLSFMYSLLRFALLPPPLQEHPFPIDTWLPVQTSVLLYALIVGLVAVFRPGERLWFYRLLIPAAVQCIAICGLKTVASLGTEAEAGKALIAVIGTVGLVIAHYFLLEKELFQAESRNTKLLVLCFYLSFTQILLLPLESCYVNYSAYSLSVSFLTASQLFLTVVSAYSGVIARSRSPSCTINRRFTDKARVFAYIRATRGVSNCS